MWRIKHAVLILLTISIFGITSYSSYANNQPVSQPKKAELLAILNKIQASSYNSANIFLLISPYHYKDEIIKEEDSLKIQGLIAQQKELYNTIVQTLNEVPFKKYYGEKKLARERFYEFDIAYDQYMETVNIIVNAKHPSERSMINSQLWRYLEKLDSYHTKIYADLVNRFSNTAIDTTNLLRAKADLFSIQSSRFNKIYLLNRPLQIKSPISEIRIHSVLQQGKVIEFLKETYTGLVENTKYNDRLSYFTDILTKNIQNDVETVFGFFDLSEYEASDAEDPSTVTVDYEISSDEWYDFFINTYEEMILIQKELDTTIMLDTIENPNTMAH